MKITNAKVFIDGAFHDDLEVKYDENGILEIGQNLVDDKVIDAKGNYLYAGIIDAHVHGGWLRNFNDIGNTLEYGDIEEQCRYILKELPKYGCTTVLPTMTGVTDESRISSVRAIRKIRKDKNIGADPFKFQFECTYMNPKQISSADHMADKNPSIENTMYFCDNDLSDVSMIGVAPELPGAMEWIKWLSSQGVYPTLGNTHADEKIIREAADNGAIMADHLFNGFKAMHHRDSSPTTAILLDDRIMCQITLDGYHVAPSWVKLALKTKGIDKFFGITDFSVYSGLSDGEHHFNNGCTVIAKDGFIYNGNGHIQSGNNMTNQIMKRTRDVIGLSMEEVGLLYAENPANCLGFTDRGKIEVGRRSDFVLMDKDYKVLKTIIKGEIYYENN